VNNAIVDALSCGTLCLDATKKRVVARFDDPDMARRFYLNPEEQP